MGFYGKEPVNPAQSSAKYLWTGLDTPGVFVVHVEGDAPNFSYGFTLVRDTHFVGGLKIDAMGWTGPLAEGITPYTAQGTFPGQYVPKIVISGSNGDFVIPVEEIPYNEVDSYIKSQATELV